MTKIVGKNSPRLLKVCKDRAYDCVYLNKKKIILGRSGTPEADAAYRQLQIQVLSDPTHSFLKGQQQVTVDLLCLVFLKYSKDYDPSHYSAIKTACEILLTNFSGLPVESLDTRHFLILQEKFVEHGISRRYCNSLMGHIRAMLKWGTLRKIVSAQVFGEAKLIPSLLKGKTSARENPRRKAVSDEVVKMTLPYMLPTHQDMVKLQLLATARPSEIRRMKAGEIDTEFTTQDGVNIWLYTPGTSKSDWREKDECKIIPLGKPEQEILGPRLIGLSDDDYVFSPRDAELEQRETRAANRKSKITPSQLRRNKRNAEKMSKLERTHYSKRSYHQIVQRAIRIANENLPDGERIPHWTPYMLRHTGITAITLKKGIDTARAVAGQKSISVTLGYNHADVLIAINQAVARSR